MLRGALCVMAKAPVAGRVKTRLGRDIGEARATALARALLRDTWTLACSVPELDVALALEGPSDGLALWPAPRLWSQGEGDLGTRLERALGRALAAHPFALVIGADCPHLPPERIRQAASALQQGADATLVPAVDGGFALLGLRTCPTGLLAELPWSVPHTASATEQRLRQRGLSVRRLAPTFDVDDGPSLEQLARGLASGGLRAPDTARVLGIAPAALALSIVMPVLDEAARIDQRLDELARLPGLSEVIVVDGGSRDGTREICLDHPTSARGLLHLVESARGRGRQLNAGAAAARGRTLLFLHADVSLPEDAAAWVERVLAEPGVVAGAFRTWTVDDRAARRAPWLHLADVRSRVTRRPYGDQALFLRAREFFAVGGFPDQSLMEDIELCRRLARRGRIVTAPRSVRVSGRRFLAHPLRDTLLVNTFPLLHRLGVDSDTLARWYRDVR